MYIKKRAVKKKPKKMKKEEDVFKELREETEELSKAKKTPKNRL